MRNLLFIFFISFSAFLQAQEVKMNAAEISNFKAMVSDISKKTTSIKTDFIQYKHLDFLENDIETSGKMVFKAPANVKWEYTKPYTYSVIFKETELLINDGGTKSNVDIGSSKLFKKLNELIVNSVKGNMFDDADFQVSYIKTPKFYKVIFTPKDKKIAEYIASFVLHFNLKDAQVMEVKMIEPSQDFTRIVFSHRVLNSKVDDSVFTH